MRADRLTSLACVLVMAVVLGMALPSMAMAGGNGVGAAAFAPDAYEPDDTTATAKAVPEWSLHTISAISEQDWCLVSVEQTGEPIVADIKPALGMIIPTVAMMPLNPDGTLGAPVPGAAHLWGGLPAPYSFLFRPSVPGVYVLTVGSAMANAGCAYWLYVDEGLSRRLEGSSRFGTAAEVSRRMWPDSDAVFPAFDSSVGGGALSPTGCIIATGRGYADALAAGAWSAWGGLAGPRMPLLLTEPGALPEETVNEVKRLAEARRLSNLPFTVYIIGGSSVVDEEVADELEELAADDGTTYVTDVVRVAGPNRFDTAVEVAKREADTGAGLGDTAVILNAWAFADGLAAGPMAGNGRAPILLTEKNTLPDSTAAFLQTHPAITKAVIVGSGSVVGNAVSNALSALSLEVTRVAGSDRYATARAVARYGISRGFLNPTSYALVTGTDYPDGLAATGLSAFSQGPTLLTHPDELSAQVTDLYAEFPVLNRPSWIVGGTPAISSDVEEEFNDLWLTAP